MKEVYGNGTIFWSESMQTFVARYPATKFGIGKKVSGYGKTKAQAIINRDKALQRALRNREKNKDSVRNTLKNYYQWLDTSDRKSNTVYYKKQRLDNYLAPYMQSSISDLGELEILSIIKTAKNHARNEEYSRVANQVYSELSQFIEYCLKRKLINSNPLLLIEKPSYKSKARQDNELHIDERIHLGIELLNFAANHAETYGTMYGVLLIASLGLRAGELRGLTWNCLTNLSDQSKDSILHVQQQYELDKATNKWNLVHWTKTDSGYRRLAIPNDWKKSLYDYWDWQQNSICLGKIRKPKNYEDKLDSNGFCFINKFGNPFTSDVMSQYWKKLKHAYEAYKQETEPDFKLTDLDLSMRLYDMRHVCASLLVSSGKATIDQLRPILGHMDRRMTEYYTHLTLESERRVMNQIPDLMGGESNTLMKLVWNPEA